MTDINSNQLPLHSVSWIEPNLQMALRYNIYLFLSQSLNGSMTYLILLYMLDIWGIQVVSWMRFYQKQFLLCRSLNTINLIKGNHSIYKQEYIFWKSCLDTKLMTSLNLFIKDYPKTKFQLHIIWRNF